MPALRNRLPLVKVTPSKVTSKKQKTRKEKKKGAKKAVKKQKTDEKKSEIVMPRINPITFTVPARRKDHLHGCCFCEDNCVKTPRRSVKVEAVDLDAEVDKRDEKGEALVDLSIVKREEPNENGEAPPDLSIVKQEEPDENAGEKEKKSEESDYIKCGFPKCSQKMHRACTEGYVCSEYTPKQAQLLFGTDAPVCPAHFCWHCNEERQKNAARFGELINCEKCMRSFHVECMPAGCKITSTNGKRKTFVCHYHAPSDPPPITSQMRVKYCTECEKLVEEHAPRAVSTSSKKDASHSIFFSAAALRRITDGEEDEDEEDEEEEDPMTRVECKGCTNVFHKKCTFKEIKGPEAEKYRDGYCSFCTVGSVIVPNQMVLAYFAASLDLPAGNFPAIAQAISAIPAEYKKKLGSNLGRLGYIPVQWVWDSELKPWYNMVPISRVQRMTQSCEKNLASDVFLGELKRCENTFLAPTLPLDNEQMMKTIKIITENVYTKGVSRKLEKKPILECNCKPINKVKCATSDCPNRIDHMECSKLCDDESKGIRCANRVMQKPDERKEVKYEVKVAPNSKGFGVFATTTIKPLEYIFEYAGEVIDKKEHERREDRMTKLRSNDEWTYFMGLTGRLVVDARFKGGNARYANHSCDPNAKVDTIDIPVKYLNSDDAMYEPKLKVQALRSIKTGEEITIDYGMVKSRGLALDTCRCGSKNCSGKIGKKAKKDDTDDERFDKNGSLNVSEEEDGSEKKNQRKEKTKKRAAKIKLPKKEENVKTAIKRRVSLGASTSTAAPKRRK